jgi:hypothetical protein
MWRILAVFVLFSVLTEPAAAQDMPLSQILIDGEGWKKVEKPGAKPEPTGLAALFTHVMPSADGGTVFICESARVSFVGAAPFVGDTAYLGAVRPYAPLRTKRGEKGIDVGGLATDRDGRIYAATELGVQVFDPTGRLCGVLTPAAPGKPEVMAFEGDKLTFWIDDAKYARKLNTTGVK